MKKSSIFFVSLLALGAVSCMEEPWAGDPQTNEQGPVMSVAGVTVDYQTPFDGEAIDLNEYDGQDLELFKYAVAEDANFPEGAQLTFNLQVAADETFSGAQAVPLTENVLSIDALNTAFAGATAGAETATDLYMRLEAFFTDGVNSYRLGGKDTYLGVKKIKVTPVVTAVEYNDVLYVIGDGCGWSHDNANKLMPIVKDGNNMYAGFAYIGSEFKLTDAPNWDNGDFGQGEGEGKLGVKGGNIKVAAAGLYYVLADINNLTYSITPITSVGLIGSFEGSGWGTDVEMTQTEDPMIWTGELTIADGDEWKFRMNNDWAVNLGGDMKNLTFDGPNIKIGGGTYSVKLNLSTLPYKATVVKK